jgi:ArsR family transcriptional regulator, arsenate/arsenite/antimonite-responsive transcriptional repressor
LFDLAAEAVILGQAKTYRVHADAPFCAVLGCLHEEGLALSTMTAGLSRPRATRVIARPLSKIKASDQTIAGLSEIFKLLADKSRLKILLALAQDGELHVSALCELLGQSQPAVSHHLTLLRMRNLVGFRRNGKHNFYRLDSALVSDLLEQFFTDSGNGHKLLQFEDFSLAYRKK